MLTALAPVGCSEAQARNATKAIEKALIDGMMSGDWTWPCVLGLVLKVLIHDASLQPILTEQLRSALNNEDLIFLRVAAHAHGHRKPESISRQLIRLCNEVFRSGLIRALKCHDRARASHSTQSGAAAREADPLAVLLYEAHEDTALEEDRLQTCQLRDLFTKATKASSDAEARKVVAPVIERCVDRLVRARRLSRTQGELIISKFLKTKSWRRAAAWLLTLFRIPAADAAPLLGVSVVNLRQLTWRFRHAGGDIGDDGVT